jgi:hypothetical protein
LSMMACSHSFLSLFRYRYREKQARVTILSICRRQKKTEEKKRFQTIRCGSTQEAGKQQQQKKKNSDAQQSSRHKKEKEHDEEQTRGDDEAIDRKEII